ncbi:cyclic diguanylate phosphodiesterase [Fibrobacterales bacterium]|nr:cyclic diguanylate phosphodiesterase [Fibrobacterales bacterium]
MQEIFVARQPILDRDHNLFAYELLFRRKQNENSTSVLDDMSATAQVLDNVLNNVGVDKLIGKNFAFINCSYELLTSEILLILNPEIFVLEILETVNIDENIVAAVKSFREKGYKIAIDDFVPKPEEYQKIKPLLPYTSIVKLEFPATNIPQIEQAVKIFHSRNIKVLAEKVETEKDFKDCLAAGCDLFQGYFFSKPEMMSSGKLDGNSMGALELLRAVDAELEISDLENRFKNQPELAVNLIKYLNSAAFATRTEITSIRHAITLLGYSNLKRWLLILAYAHSTGGSGKSPLLADAVRRASLFENIAKSLSWEKSKVEKSYLMGLVSRLDALYKVSMGEILSQISLDDEVSSALLNNKGLFGLLLLLTDFLEKDDVNGADGILERLGLSMESFSACLLKSYENAEGI